MSSPPAAVSPFAQTQSHRMSVLPGIAVPISSCFREMKMLKNSFTEAVFLLREVTSTLPSEAESRSEFFVQWRARSIETLERLFPGDPEPARQFKELEFSPR